MSSTFKQYLIFSTVAICLLGIAIINSGLTPLTAVTDSQVEISAMNLTAPPGFIFSIWGIIYLGFLVYGVYHALPIPKSHSRFRKSFPWIMASIGMNFLWIALVGFDLVLAAYFLQWVMLYAALLILIRAEAIKQKTPLVEKILSVTFNFYAGWLTVAMVPFTADLLLSFGWRGEPFAPEVWAIALYLIASAIVFFVYRYIKTIWIMIPLLWAFFGFVIKFDGIVAIAAGILMVIGLSFIGYRSLSGNKAPVDNTIYR